MFFFLLQLDALFRSLSIGEDFVGLEDLTIINSDDGAASDTRRKRNSDGVVVLDFKFHMVPDTSYSGTDIEASLDERVSGGTFATGNCVLEGSFLVG